MLEKRPSYLFIFSIESIAQIIIIKGSDQRFIQPKNVRKTIVELCQTDNQSNLKFFRAL